MVSYLLRAMRRLHRCKLRYFSSVLVGQYESEVFWGLQWLITDLLFQDNCLLLESAQQNPIMGPDCLRLNGNNSVVTKRARLVAVKSRLAKIRRG